MATLGPIVSEELLAQIAEHALQPGVSVPVGTGILALVDLEREEAPALRSRVRDLEADVSSLRGALAFVATYVIQDPNTPADVLLRGLQRVASSALASKEK